MTDAFVINCKKMGSSFNTQDFHTISRISQRRSALQAVNRDYEVTFSNLKSQVDKIKLTFGHALSSLTRAAKKREKLVS